MSGDARPALLAIAPHPDDVAWSAGGLVLAATEAGLGVVVVTVMGASRYAPGVPDAPPDDVSGIRREEDRAWADAARAAHHWHELPDASLRGFDDVSERLHEPEPELVGLVARRLAALMSGLRPTLLLAPAGIGAHVDHLAVRHAVRSMRAAPVVWYEDMTYACEAGVELPGDEGRLLLDVSRWWARKEQGVLRYRSQLPGPELDLIRAHARALWASSGSAGEGACERVWAPGAAGELLRRLLGPTLSVLS